jgi:hypothetical protein
MDMNIIYRLVFLGLGLVVIGIGAAMTYLGSYLAAPEEKKQGRGRNMLIYGIILVILGFAYLIYCQFTVRG